MISIITKFSSRKMKVSKSNWLKLITNILKWPQLLVTQPIFNCIHASIRGENRVFVFHTRAHGHASTGIVGIACRIAQDCIRLRHHHLVLKWMPPALQIMRWRRRAFAVEFLIIRVCSSVAGVVGDDAMSCLLLEWSQLGLQIHNLKWNKLIAKLGLQELGLP